MTRLPLKSWKLYWAPEGRCLGVVLARTAREAIRKAEQPYRKYLGEIYAEEFNSSSSSEKKP